jgi:AcrR family transcriptional regulator
MNGRSRQVKRTEPRRYDSSGRRERARQTHDKTLDVAQSLFLEQGYAATTVQSVADRAGVSAATIYKTYAGKSGLVRAVCRRALAGAGPIPAEERSNALRSSAPPHVVIEDWGRLVAEVSPRIAPLLLVLRDAAGSDDEAAFLVDELEQARLSRMADNARFLAKAGGLRPGVSVNDARDVLWACSSPELYDLLVNRRRWSVAKYSRFVTNTMSGTLL